MNAQTVFDLVSAVELTLSAAIVVLVISSIFARSAIERALIMLGFGGWFVGVLWIGASGAFHYRGGPGIAGLGAAVLIPFAIMSWLGLKTSFGRVRLQTASLPALTAVHAVRVLGISFLALFSAHRLPAPFAPIAGTGDILIGLTALPVAWWLATRRSDGGLAFTWNALGLLDLVAAIGLGAMSSPDSPIHLFRDPPGSAVMTTLPWILIPCFLVPSLAFIHLLVFHGLKRAKAARMTRSPLPA
jgi:hypothetical protein